MVVLTSFSEPTVGIRHRQQNTTVYVNDNNLGKGTLYIAESRLSWIGEAGNGFSIEYPHISLHAISRDLSAFPQECLFLMLDTPLGDEDYNGEEENDEANDSNREETTEMRLVPDDRGMLDAMFHAMNTCQTLHPDPEDSFSDEDFFEDADDEIPMEEADSQMARCSENRKHGRESTHGGQGGGHGGGQGGGQSGKQHGFGHFGGQGGGQGGGHFGGHGRGQHGLGHFGGQGGGQHGFGHFGGQGGGQGGGQHGFGHFGGGHGSGQHGFGHFGGGQGGGHGGEHEESHGPG